MTTALWGGVNENGGTGFRARVEGCDVAGETGTLKLDLKQAQKRPQAISRRKGGDPVAGGSWGAARARAGEVTPGVTRDEIMRPAKEDPRAEDGVFARVSGLLADLSGGLSIE